MKLIIGLGNPGRDYDKTRHNVGFMAISKFADDNSLNWKEKSKLNAYIAEGDGFILAKPTTFMNESGQAVAALKQFYKPDEILVIADDIDRDFGSLRVRKGGGSGGQNGLQSIIGAIGDDFYRLRISVQNEHRTRENASQFVLAGFSSEEKKHLPAVLQAATDQIREFLTDSLNELTIHVVK